MATFLPTFKFPDFVFCVCMCARQNCIRPAKTLSYMINSRHVAVISDVELSVLKVSLLERVQFHQPPPVVRRPLSSSVAAAAAGAASRERKGATSSSSYGRAAAAGRAPSSGVAAAAVSAVLVAFQFAGFFVWLHAVQSAHQFQHRDELLTRLGVSKRGGSRKLWSRTLTRRSRQTSGWWEKKSQESRFSCVEDLCPSRGWDVEQLNCINLKVNPQIRYTVLTDLKSLRLGRRRKLRPVFCWFRLLVSDIRWIVSVLNCTVCICVSFSRDGVVCWCSLEEG